MYIPAAPAVANQSFAAQSTPTQPPAKSEQTNDILDLFCCEGEECNDKGVECCVDPSCHDVRPGSACSDCGLEDLEAWACTKEGCQAIQQYVSLLISSTLDTDQVTFGHVLILVGLL